MLDTGLRQGEAEYKRMHERMMHFFRLAKDCIKQFGPGYRCSEVIGEFTNWNSRLRDYFRVRDLLEDTVIRALPLF
jgi:hypothetical protein